MMTVEQQCRGEILSMRIDTRRRSIGLKLFRHPAGPFEITWRKYWKLVTFRFGFLNVATQAKNGGRGSA